MNIKVIILIAVFFATSASCMAQVTAKVYSQNNEANTCYTKALDYIKIGNPRNGGSIDSLLIAVKWLEKAVNTDPRFVTAYIELCKTYWMFDFSYPNFPNYNSSAVVILPKAKDAIYKALQIDSTSSEAFSQLARMNKNYEYKWDEALKNMQKQFDTIQQMQAIILPMVKRLHYKASGMKHKHGLIRPIKWHQQIVVCY